MDVNKILFLLLIAIMLPSLGFALSAIAGGKGRTPQRPPEHAPGENYYKRAEQERPALGSGQRHRKYKFHGK